MRSAQPTAAQLENPGLGLAVTLGLIALGFLPLMGGGYSSGGGFQVGYVLLPLAAGIAWAAIPYRPRWVQPLLVIYVLAALPLMPWLLQGGREIWYYVLQVPAAWVVAWACLRHDADRGRWLWPVVTGSAVLTAAYGWFLWAGSGTLAYQMNSTFGLHNAFAGYLLLAWPAALVAAVTTGHQRWRWAYTAAGVFLVATLVLTHSRAAWVVMALQFAALAAWALWRRGRGDARISRLIGIFSAAAVICGSVLLALPGGRDTLGRIFDFTGYSFQGRLRFWEAAVEIFRDHPLGVGLGNFAYVYPQYQKDYVYYSIDPHSWPLQLVSELGVFGLLLSLALIAGVVLWVRRVWRGTQGGPAAVLLIAAVGGSLVHAGLDFDYYFGAVTSLLGVLLAVGTHLATPAEATSPPAYNENDPEHRRRKALARLAALGTMLLLLCAAAYGEMLTLERYQLDHLRDNPGLSPRARLALLENATRYNRFNHRTHYQLASILAAPGDLQDSERARGELDLSLRLNPLYTQGWALKGLLSADPVEGDRYLEKALRIDPYNFPDHYFYYANLARTDAAKRDRLLLGLERIPAEHPIKPDHPRPTWHELNPMWAEWYYELARLTDDPAEKDRYQRIGASFEGYWNMVLRERQGDQAKAQPE